MAVVTNSPDLVGTRLFFNFPYWNVDCVHRDREPDHSPIGPVGHSSTGRLGLVTGLGLAFLGSFGGRFGDRKIAVPAFVNGIGFNGVTLLFNCGPERIGGALLARFRLFRPSLAFER